MSSAHWQGGFVFNPVYNMLGIQRRIRGCCPRKGYHLALRHLFVLMLPCSATHLRRASLFVPHSIQLRGHELPEARVFTLYLLQVVPMSEDYHDY